MSRITVALVAVLAFAPTIAHADPVMVNYDDLKPGKLDETLLWPHTKKEVIAEVTLCVGKTGKVSSVTLTDPSDDPKFDRMMVRTLKKWRYHPYKQDGKPIAVCSNLLVAGMTKKMMRTGPPPPPPPSVETVTPQALEAQRLSGDANPQPDTLSKDQIAKSGKTRVITALKLCIDTGGQVTSVTMLKSSGFAGYDDVITTALKAWTFKPYLVNGAAAPVCTAVTLIYTP